MKKKIWVCLLVLSLVFGFMNTSPCAAANQDFPDVGNHWAKDYINQLTSLGYMAGYPDGTFKPDKIMTRAEFTGVLISCMGFTASDKTSNNFSDTSGSWAIASINEAVKHGILVPSEYPNGLVPDGGIKRSEACAMLVRALGKSPGTGIPSFNDTAKLKLSMYVGYIQTACDLGIMSGFPNGNFEPFSEMPRAQACTVLYKLLAQQGKVPAVPASTTTSSTTSSTGSINYVVIDDQSYDLKTVSVSFIENFIEIPIKSISASTSNVNVNNTYTFNLNSTSNNPDIIVYNSRYGVSKLTVNGDKLVVTPTYRKVYKFKVGDYSYTSDYVSLYVNSANKNYYLSDMGIIDEDHVKIGSQNYDLSSDKITISVNPSGSSSSNFYDIKNIDLTQQDAEMQLSATDPVVMNQLSISDITAIFTDNSTLNLDSISHIYFIMGGKRYSLSDVTIDATGNFDGGDEVYPYTIVTMIVDNKQYEINSLQINKSKFIFYCGEGTNQEWVIIDDEYRDAADVSIIFGSSIYSLDQVIVVTNNVIRIDGVQYNLASNSDFKCRVDNETYYIDEIDYDSSQQATTIDTGDLADTSIANQPSKFVFFNKNTEYQEGTKNTTIYTTSKWVTFDQIFISDPSHFIYKDTTHDLIGAEIKIDDLEFEVVDTSWHGASHILDVYLQAI